MPDTVVATEKIKRPLIAHFLDVSQAATYTGADWTRLGKNVTEANIEYSPQSETEQDIISDSATTETTGYQPTMSVNQKCTKGDPVFELVTKLRRKRATLAECHTWLLNVDMWDYTGTEGNRTYVGEVQEVSVQVNTYGGTGGEAPAQEFTLNFVGDPIPGKVTVTGKKPVFTADSTV